MTDPPTAPSVGQIVHYTSYGTPGGEYPSVCRAAIVTEVPELLAESGPNIGPQGYVKAINLAVINPKGVFFDIDVAYDPEKVGGTWHWPCVRST